jgi:hypothetical protein
VVDWGAARGQDGAHELCRGRHLHLAQDDAAVSLDRPDADAEGRRDLLRRAARNQLLEHLALASREAWEPPGHLLSFNQQRARLLIDLAAAEP